MAQVAFSLALVLLVAGSAYGYPTGAPTQACDDMIPRHGVDEKLGAIPITVTSSKDTVQANEEVSLVISGTNEFKGFLIEVREGDKAVGTFKVAANDANAQTLDCHGTEGSAATHKDAEFKNNVKLVWKAPAKPGNYKIFLTIVETKTVFWARREVGHINVV